MPKLRIDETDTGFRALLDGRTFFDHQITAPAWRVGRGDGAMSSHHGVSLLSRDRVAWAPVPRDFHLENMPAGEVRVHFPPYGSLHFAERDGHAILRPEFPGFNRIDLHFPCLLGDTIRGVGEQFSRVNLKGSRVPLWVSEPGIGRSFDFVSLVAATERVRGRWHSSYFPLPQFASRGGWFVSIDLDEYGVFDFRPEEGFGLYAWEIPREIRIGAAESLGAAIRGLSDLVGRQPPLPDWADDGIWLAIQGGRRVVEEKLDRAQSAGMNVAAVWSQDWQGIRRTRFGTQLYWNWQADPELFPDIAAMISGLSGRGVRFLGYNNPFLAIESPQFADAARQGYLVRNGSGFPLVLRPGALPVGLLDLTNPGCREWIRGIIRTEMIATGMSGWMCDFGEHLPRQAVLHDGDAGSFHSPYAAAWAAVNAEAIAESSRKDLLFFNRSGWAGSHHHTPVAWAGDQLVTFSRHDGLPAAVSALLSLSASGFGFTHFDVGGFFSAWPVLRTRELLLRSAETAAFTPIFRTHEGIRPESNHQWDSSEDTLRRFVRLSRIFAALKPYRRQVFQEYGRSGAPVVRHVADSSSHPSARTERTQFLLGPDVLVAPVLRRGARHRTVLVPKGQWIHLWTGQPAEPGRRRVASPLGFPPVFYRAESGHAGLFEGLRLEFGVRAVSR